MQPISERALKPIPTLDLHEEKAGQAAISKRGKKNPGKVLGKVVAKPGHKGFWPLRKELCLGVPLPFRIL